MNNETLVLRYLISKRDHRASVPEMATNLDLECKQVRGAIDRLRGKHGKNFIINDPPRSKYFRLNYA